MRFTAAKGERTEEFGRISNEAIETYTERLLSYKKYLREINNTFIV